jgi:hypothetical protein
MFEHVKEEDHVEIPLQGGLLLENVVAAHLTLPAYVLLQGVFIQIKPRDFPSVGILDLSLKQAVAAPDFGQNFGTGDLFLRQPT